MDVIVDGHLCRSLNKNEYVMCEKTDRTVKIIRIDPPNFYTTVRTKLLERSNEEAE